MTGIPLLGASLSSVDLGGHLDWLAAGDRDLEITDPCDPGMLDGDWRPVADGIARMLREAGHRGRTGVHAAWHGIDLSTPDPYLQQAMTRRLRQSLHFGEAFGASHLVVHSPFVWFGHPLVHFSSEAEVLPFIDAAHAILEPLLPDAAKVNCCIVIESCWDLNPGPLAALVRSFASPLVGMSVDVGHAEVMRRLGGPPADHWIRQAGDLLAHVHLDDTDGSNDWHWTVGRGSVPWESVLRELAALPETPRCILEIEDLQGSCAWLAERGLAR
ncbi:MAG: sugar phosphate isomerase/epimerase family protein [Chloroflexota bacterium]